MTPRLLAQQLRQRQRWLMVIPDEVLDALSDESVIRSYCVSATTDGGTLEEIVATCETVHDFLDKLISDREAAKRMWPPCTAAILENELRSNVDESTSDLLRYLPFSHMRDFGSPIVFAFTEQMVQEFAAANLDGTLTEDELCDLHLAFCESFYESYLDDVISKVRPRVRD